MFGQEGDGSTTLHFHYRTRGALGKVHEYHFRTCYKDRDVKVVALTRQMSTKNMNNKLARLDLEASVGYYQSFVYTGTCEMP